MLKDVDATASRRNLMPALTLWVLVLVASAQAQELRYELGSRLRLFEREFESLKTPEERAIALPALSGAVQKFFAMQLQTAAQDLDSARLAIHPAAGKQTFGRAVNMRLSCSARWLDPAVDKLDCQILPLYGDAYWKGIRLFWEMRPMGATDDAPAAMAGELALDGGSTTKLRLDLVPLPAQDYWLRLSATDSTTDGANMKPVQLLERMISLSSDPRGRLERLVSDVEQLSASQPADQAAGGDGIQLASLQGNARMLGRILAGEALETDFPASGLLEFCEKALVKIKGGQAAYGDKQIGEYWVVTGKEAGGKWLRLRAPAAAASGKPLPLVLALHGAGGSENMFFDSYGDGKVVRLSDQRQWLLAAPRAGFGYSGFNLDQLVDSIDKLYPVDRSAVFVVGHSMGAGGAIALTATASLKPTAVAALGGGRGVSDAQPFKDVPFFVAAGSDDFGRTGAKQLADTLEAGGVNVRYLEYENVEHLAIVQVALEDVFAFFDSHRSRPTVGQSDAPRSGLRIDQLQLAGTHNSYHLAPDEVAAKTIAAFAPGQAQSLDNSQRPLYEQFEKLGVRHIELDLYLDPEGKLFSKPLSYTQAKSQAKTVPEFDPESRLTKPGIKVLHSPDFDFRTTTYTLVDALKEVKRWSDAHRRHVPIFVLLELKSDSFSPLTRPLPWNEQSLDELEKEILSVFPHEQILTPDTVRGSAATVREAVEGRGWPSVDSQRGKVAFLMDNEGAEKDLYLSRSPILEGRLLFVSVSRDHPAAAWMKLNNAVGSFDTIAALVKSGFLIRTRADVGTVEARNNDTRRRDQAIASGAQLISTDYPEPDPRFSSYCLTLTLPNEQ